ncbi:MAG TPA: glycosyltransferase [Chitinophagaceae bacterium]|nr:glycosyltransferase [Chitinophagaceae bacterium]
MDNPLVTIITVCYNQERWVEETLNSIKNQTYPNIQLIVADDGSKDNSKQVIRKWIAENMPGARFIDHTINLGLTKNLNSALPYIKGEYFQAFGCDDIMMPDKIESQVQLLEENKDAAVIFSDMYFINTVGEKLPGSYFEKHAYKKPRSGTIYKDLIDRFIISAPSVLQRTSLLAELGGYNETLDFEDHEFFLRAAKKHPYLYTDNKTVLYRITGESLSTKRNELKFFKNSFLIYYQNFDSRREYKPLFIKKLLFYAKNLYYQKFKYTYSFCIKAFTKTGNWQFLKYGIAGLPYYFISKKSS